MKTVGLGKTGLELSRVGMGGIPPTRPTDGPIKPDIVLPGEGIISCRAKDTSLGNPVVNIIPNSREAAWLPPTPQG